MSGPKKMGRPRRMAGATSNYPLRLSYGERAAYQAAADKAGETLADWIREACCRRVAQDRNTQETTMTIKHVMDLDALTLISHEERDDGLIGITVRYQGEDYEVLAAANQADPSRWEPGGDSVDQWLPQGLPLEVGREAIAQASARWA